MALSYGYISRKTSSKINYSHGHLSKYLDDDQYRTLQAELATNPELGDLMRGSGGFRKMRCADARRGKGRRGGLGANRARGSLTSRSDATSDPILSLIPVDEAARLGEKLGIDRPYATSNVYRGLLNSPSATAGFSGLVNALFFHNKVAARTRELIILRIGWRTGSEYVFCNHVRFSRDFGIPDEEILGVRDPQRCHAYSKTDRAVLHLADELHEHAEVTRSTWTVLDKAFARDELVELLLIAGFWRMAAGFVKSAKIPLDAGVPSWPEGRKPNNSAPE